MHVVRIQSQTAPVGWVNHDHARHELLLRALQVLVQDLENLRQASEDRPIAINQTRNLVHPRRHCDAMLETRTQTAGAKIAACETHIDIQKHGHWT